MRLSSAGRFLSGVAFSIAFVVSSVLLGAGASASPQWCEEDPTFVVNGALVDVSTTFAYEYAGAVRNINLKDPGPPPVDSWMGQSVGHWEGNTFIVEVTGFNDGSWFDRAGNHHTEDLKVVERYTMTGPDHIRYEATMTDPSTRITGTYLWLSSKAAGKSNTTTKVSVTLIGL